MIDKIDKMRIFRDALANGKFVKYARAADEPRKWTLYDPDIKACKALYFLKQTEPGANTILVSDVENGEPFVKIDVIEGMFHILGEKKTRKLKVKW